MNTLIIKEATQDSLEAAGRIIREGGIVAFPTETVYGLGANAFDPEAIKKIYVAKGRPSDNPLIVHISEVSEMEGVAREIPENAKKLLAAFAPGPFTLILKKNKNIPDCVTAGLDTVGIRIPSHPTARAFIKAAGVPIAAPSANISGKPSPTKAEHVILDMDGRADAIICGGSSEVGVESTIIDMTSPVPTILRPGGITKEDIESVLGEAQVDKNVLTGVKAGEQPKCPGMKYKHYAPNAQVIVVEGNREKATRKIEELLKIEREGGKKCGVMALGQASFDADFYLSEGESNKDFANCLFDSLREFDKLGADTVFVQFSIHDNMELAVKNRLYQSAGYNIIYVGE